MPRERPQRSGGDAAAALLLIGVIVKNAIDADWLTLFAVVVAVALLGMREIAAEARRRGDA